VLPMVMSAGAQSLAFKAFAARTKVVTRACREDGWEVVDGANMVKSYLAKAGRLGNIDKSLDRGLAQP